MRIVDTNELKIRLDEILRRVAAGEVVLVRNRSGILAEIGPPRRITGRDEIDPGVAAMIAAGELSAAGPNVPEVYPALSPTSCGSSRELLDSERGDRA